MQYRHKIPRNENKTFPETSEEIMRKKLLAVCALMALAAMGWGQSGGNAGWSKYSNDGGKFSVMLPATPDESSSAEKGILLHTFQVIQRPRMYMVIYSDYPDADLKLETSTRLKAERDGFLKGVSDGKVVSEREFKSKRGNTELPALEFTSETNNLQEPGGPGRTACLFCLCRRCERQRLNQPDRAFSRVFYPELK
jgi:hypothetical protein